MSRAVKELVKGMGPLPSNRPGNDPAGSSRGHPVHRSGPAVGQMSVPPSYDPDSAPTDDLESELYKHGGRVVHKDHYASGGKFIQKAIKHPGRETKRAKEHGVSVHEQMVKDSHSPNKSLRGAGALGLRLSAMSKNK